MPADSTAVAAKAAPTAHAADGNVKETIESILVAFILAFIFRAFVVEAFVIPTGSMAPTLLGAHMRFHCTDCGYGWDVNFSSGGSRDDDRIPAFAVGQRYDQFPHQIRCPNCGFPVPPSDPDDPGNEADQPPVHYGDRILVLKYSYLLHPPDRWDVVVFKSPHEDGPPDPAQFRYSQNYIKRLVGKPHERVMVLDGDVYIGRPGETDPRKFQVQRKPRVVQEALWRPVYDNDYLPHLKRSATQVAWRQPWAAEGTGWDLHDGTPAARAFDFKDAGGAGELRFDPAANPDVHNLTDWLPYDEVYEQEQHGGRRSMPAVTDLKLAFHYTRTAGDGPLVLKLPKGPYQFAAHLKNGSVELTRSRDGGAPDSLKTADAPELKGNAPVRVEFQNVDYRVSLSLNGRELFAVDYEPDVESLINLTSTGQSLPTPEVRIGASQQVSRIEHLVLSRDVYYLNGYNATGAPWGTPPHSIMDLGDDEFFVLGDNSLISGDARTWTSDARDRVVLPDENLISKAGVVPGRFMLGKAFFVYWPAGHRPWSRAPFGIIPNFGDMRFIH